MRKISLAAVLATYAGLALVGLARERQAVIACECEDDCWCKRPPFALFRWVLPVGHHLARTNT